MPSRSTSRQPLAKENAKIILGITARTALIVIICDRNVNNESRVMTYLGYARACTIKFHSTALHMDIRYSDG